MKQRFLLPLVGLGLISLSSYAQNSSTDTNTAYIENQDWTSGRPDGHAPIGVMGDHRHSQGEWMLSYRYMRMGMEGNLNGTTELSNEAIFANYMVAPQQMTMTMHMVGLMYAPTDRLTLMTMAQYVTNDMDLRAIMGMNFNTKGQNFGDTRLTALYGLFNRNQQSMHLNLGVSVPTGSISERDATPAEASAQLPYPMQTGSGTWDLLPGITYLGQTDRISWGAQASGVVRLGENDRGYTLGNELNATGWLAYRWSRWVSNSLRLAGSAVGTLSGQDAALNPMMVTTADTRNFGGQRVTGLIGVNFYVPEGFLYGHRLGVEFGLPLYQHLNGPQMEQQSVLTLGWQWAF